MQCFDDLTPWAAQEQDSAWKTVAVNEAGRRVGEDHPGAKLTNAEVECIRELHETEGLGYGLLAVKFELSKSAIAKICRYERRAQFAVRVKAVLAR